MTPDAGPDQDVPIESTSFEDAYRRLEAVVKRLEEDGLALDEALRAYEEGSLLADRCAALLETARLRLTRLTSSGAELPIE